jgi:predicted RND superfamily exporter protein
MDRAFVTMASWGLTSPRTTCVLTGILLVMSVLSGLGMRFHAEITDLIPSSSVEAFRRLEEVFGATDNAFLLITSDADGSDAALVDFAGEVAARLRPSPLVKSVSFGWSELVDSFSSSAFLACAPLFARADQLDALDHLLTPEGIKASVRKQSAQLGLPGIGEAEKWVERDPLELRSLCLPRLGAMRGSFRSRPGSMHLLSEDGRSLLVRIEGRAACSDIPKVQTIVRSIRSAVEQARETLASKHPGVQRFHEGLTGGYAFAFETEAAIRGDLTQNVVMSFLLVLGLVAFAFRHARLAVFSMAPLLVGMGLGFGAFSMVRREVVSLAFVSGAMLAGLGINYVIYVHVRTFTDARGPTSRSVLDAVRATGRPMLFAALTTAAGFAAFPMTGERFLSDLGLLSAVGILCCLGATVVLFPVVLRPWALRGDRGGFTPAELEKLRPRDLGAVRLARIAVRWPGAVFVLSILSGLLSIACLVVWPPRFETDLRNMHPAGSEALETQKKIAKIFGGAEEPILLLVEATSSGGKTDLESAAVDAAARLDEPLSRLLKEGLIAAWQSPSQVLPRAEEQRAAIEVMARKDAAALETAFRDALESEGFDTERFAGQIETLRAALRTREPIAVARLRELGLSAILEKMIGVQGGTGYALIAVQPSNELWHVDEQAKVFAALEGALRSAGVRGELAGLNVISAKSASAILGEFLTVSGLAAGAVVALVVILFRRAKDSALALFPLLLGTLWMAVACDLLGIRLNFMNVGVLPLVLGTGIDIGIHVVQLFLNDPERDVPALFARTGTSIILASLTTLAGFGTMAFSVNPGIRSVGAISAIGMTACLLASLVSLPAALELRTRRPGGGAA